MGRAGGDYRHAPGHLQPRLLRLGPSLRRPGRGHRHRRPRHRQRHRHQHPRPELPYALSPRLKQRQTGIHEQLSDPIVVSSSIPRGANHLGTAPESGDKQPRHWATDESGRQQWSGRQARGSAVGSLAICARCPTSAWLPPIRLSVCRSPQPPARLANASTRWPGGGTLLDCRLGPRPGRGQKDH